MAFRNLSIDNRKRPTIVGVARLPRHVSVVVRDSRCSTATPGSESSPVTPAPRLGTPHPGRHPHGRRNEGAPFPALSGRPLGHLPNHTERDGGGVGRIGPDAEPDDTGASELEERLPRHACRLRFDEPSPSPCKPRWCGGLSRRPSGTMHGVTFLQVNADQRRPCRAYPTQRPNSVQRPHSGRPYRVLVRPGGDEPVRADRIQLGAPHRPGSISRRTLLEDADDAARRRYRSLVVWVDPMERLLTRQLTAWGAFAQVG
jgi:hypothetical protein